MANPRNAVIDVSSPVGAAEISNLLVDLENVRGFFSGKLIDYRMPCTASEDRTCQIFSNLSVWNEFLCPLQLELRELSEAGRQLGLVETSRWDSTPSEGRLRQAVTVLYWLLSIHHCVARIQIGRIIASGQNAELCVPVLCEILKGNSSLKSVILGSSFYAEFQSEEMEKFSNVISSLKCPEKLELPFHPYFCPRSLSAILRSTTTLTVLDWSSIIHVEVTLAQRFLAVLRTNSTMLDLSLSVVVINADPALFLEFLTCHGRLQKLRVILNCDCCSDDSLRWILKGMLKNRSVSSLQAENVFLDFESVELASEVLAENRVLRSFWLSPRISMLNTYTAVLLHRTSRNTTAFQEAIARNNTLQYMTLNFSIWSAEHWAPFFRVLSEHTSLKVLTIHVGEEDEYSLLPCVVKALQESGSEKKVLFKAPCIAGELAVPDCMPFCELGIGLCDETKDRMLPLVQQLSKFSLLKELNLTLESGNYTIISAIFEYIAMTSTVRKLCVHVSMFSSAHVLVHWLPALSRSLLLNRSIAELSIRAYLENTGQNFDLLGDAVMRSPTIRKLNLVAFQPLDLFSFIRGLRPEIFKNYALCSVTGDYPNFSMDADWFAVRETSRRNAGFVARAAQFLNDARCDRLCAAGLDRVSRHPALVAELAEVLSIGQVEAADMVQRRFRSIEGLHEFMRLAGVVKGRVTCLPREDGRMQLDDLNDDCWAHVRRYLALDDVAYSYGSL